MIITIPNIIFGPNPILIIIYARVSGSFELTQITATAIPIKTVAPATKLKTNEDKDDVIILKLSFIII
jgi:hypothetical protein